MDYAICLRDTPMYVFTVQFDDFRLTHGPTPLSPELFIPVLGLWMSRCDIRF